MRFILLFFINISLSQTIKGVVLDSENQDQLMYANVTLNNQKFGVATNEKGFFSIELPSNLVSDSLSFSYLGYKTKKIKIDDINSDLELKINLVKDISSLDEIVLSVSKYNYSSVNSIKVKRRQLITTSIPYGYEKITFIDNKKNLNGLITEVILHFNENKAKDYLILPTFYRLKFFSKKINRFYPDKLLSLNNIIIRPENKTQSLTLNVSKFNIPFPKEGFFIGLEAIDPIQKKQKKNFFLTKPAILMSHSKECLSFTRYRDGNWSLSNSKSRFKNRPFYKNLFIGLKVKYRKE